MIGIIDAERLRQERDAARAELAQRVRYAADAVVFAQEYSKLYVLMIQRKYDPYIGAWALPGGHVDPDETSRQAATRELAEETGLPMTDRFFVEVGVFDKPGRDPRGRYVSVAYTTILTERRRVVGADDAAMAEWVPLNEALGMSDAAERAIAFDHREIVQRAWGLVGFDRS